MYGPRAARIAAGLTVAECAKRAGLDDTYIRRIERLYDLAAEARLMGRKATVTLASVSSMERHAVACGANINLYYRFAPLSSGTPCRHNPQESPLPDRDPERRIAAPVNR